MSSNGRTVDFGSTYQGSIPCARIHSLVSLCRDGEVFYFCYTFQVLLVAWPSVVATKAEVWRVLDLSGMTTSVRQSRNFVKAGFVFLDGNPISTLRDQMDLGRNYCLEIRFPNGVIVARNLRLVKPVRYKARTNTPDTRYQKP